MTKKKPLISFDLRPWQAEAIQKMNRFTVLVVHRRAGKTMLNVFVSILEILQCKHRNPVGHYWAATEEMLQKAVIPCYKAILANMIEKGMCVVTSSDKEMSVKFATGAEIHFYTYTNPDNKRGIFADHIVFDEYQLAPQGLLKVTRSMLSDRKGKAIFSGTPDGRNHFYQLFKYAESGEDKEFSAILKTVYDTNVTPKSEVESIRRMLSDEEFAQEYLCSFDAAIEGSAYCKNMNRLVADGRVKEITYEPSYPVTTGIDLGLDGTCIWYCQTINNIPHLIDVDFFEGEDMSKIINTILNKPYIYANQWLPHDGNDRSIVNKILTPFVQMKNSGLKTSIAKKLSIESGVHATRVLLDKAIIAKKCDKNIILKSKKIVNPVESLSLYRFKVTSSGGLKPEHKEHSHIADALRTLAVGLNEKSDGNLGKQTTTGVKVYNMNWETL